MEKIERDNKGRFIKGITLSSKFYKKAVQTRKNTILKRGYYFTEEIRKRIGEKNKISLKGKKLSESSIKKRYETRLKRGWYKNRNETLKRIRGQNSKLWLGGERRKDYGTEFNNELKREIIKRDKNICQICGLLLDGNIHIHHVDYDKKNNIIGNMLSLCNSCHSKTNYNRRYWFELLANFISQKNSKYNEVWEYANIPLQIIVYDKNN